MLRISFNFQSPAPPAPRAFPPAPAQTTNSPAQLTPASNATTTPTAAPTLSQQEQLAQLDRVLERLGINPQSLSLDNRLALIKSANDPPALLTLVRSLGVLNQAATTGQQTSALNANHLSNPARPELQHEPQLRTNLKPSLHLHPPLRLKAQVRRRSLDSRPLCRRSLRRHPRKAQLLLLVMAPRSSSTYRLSSKEPRTLKVKAAPPVRPPRRRPR
jgi:hypothetical protein